MVKFIKCQKCGKSFAAPVMDIKRFGYGVTIPGLGLVECPSCHNRDRRKRFLESTEEEAARVEKPVVEAKKTEAEDVEDSKFESE